jgi:hypothetical protein
MGLTRLTCWAGGWLSDSHGAHVPNADRAALFVCAVCLSVTCIKQVHCLDGSRSKGRAYMIRRGPHACMCCFTVVLPYLPCSPCLCSSTLAALSKLSLGGGCRRWQGGSTTWLEHSHVLCWQWLRTSRALQTALQRARLCRWVQHSP